MNKFIFDGKDLSSPVKVVQYLDDANNSLEACKDMLEIFHEKYPAYGLSNLRYYIGEPYRYLYKLRHDKNEKIKSLNVVITSLENDINKDFNLWVRDHQLEDVV